MNYKRLGFWVLFFVSFGLMFAAPAWAQTCTMSPAGLVGWWDGSTGLQFTDDFNNDGVISGWTLFNNIGATISTTKTGGLLQVSHSGGGPTGYLWAGVKKVVTPTSDFTVRAKLRGSFGGRGPCLTLRNRNATDVNGVSKGGLKVVVDGTGASCTSPNTTTQNLTGFYLIPLAAGASSIARLYNATCNQVGLASFGPVAQDQFLQIDFPNLNPADPVIEGVVGTRVGGVGNVAAELVDVAGRAIATTSTNSGGYYSFRFAAPGTYTVRVTPPAGYQAERTSTIVTINMFETVRADFTLTR